MISPFWQVVGFLILLFSFTLVRADLYKIKKKLGIIAEEENAKNAAQ